MSEARSDGSPPPAPKLLPANAGPGKPAIGQGVAGMTRPGKDMTRAGKREVITDNGKKNGGIVVCAACKSETVKAKQSKSGVTPHQKEARVDHKLPKSKGGDGAPHNGEVLCDTCNNKKSNKMPGS
jgi:hypothetical protein